MANNKTNIKMQIDVSFVSNASKMIKELEQTFTKSSIGSTIGKSFTDDITKNFKNLDSLFTKMQEGLMKPGLNAKQYTDFFDNINSKIKDSVKYFEELKTSAKDLFDSPKNQRGLDQIKELEKIQSKITARGSGIGTKMRYASTRQSTIREDILKDYGIDYNISKRELTETYKRYKSGSNFTPNQLQWLDANKLASVNKETEEIVPNLEKIEPLMKKISEYMKNTITYSTNSKELFKLTGFTDPDKAEFDINKKLTGLKEQYITPEDLKAFNISLAEISPQMKEVNNLFSNIFGERGRSEIKLAEQEMIKYQEGVATIKEIFAQFGITFSIAQVVRGFQSLARAAYDFYKSLDSALNEIYVVSNLTSNSVNGLKNEFIGMAKDTGMALDDITRSAVLFYQQGLNTKEVLEMTEVTSQFAKVAGIDATDAADKLTAAVNGYCLAAEDAANVADKFNKVAAASAADIDELSTAFSKAAAQANQAGVSMDNYLAYIATMVEATREAPENIGTSLKTIFSRMQQVKEAGTSEDGETDVNKVETALRSVNIALRDTSGELRDLEDVFDELGPRWNSLDRNTQAYLGTIIAGTRQQSRFITLMQNWDRVLDLANQSANSAGMQALMHAKAMDSITSNIQQMQVAAQEFTSNITSSSVIKNGIKFLTTIIDLFNDGNKPVILMATAISLLESKLQKLQIPLEKIGKEWNTAFKGLTGKITLGKDTFNTEQEKNDAIEIIDKQIEAQNNNTEHLKYQLDLMKSTKVSKDEIRLVENQIEESNRRQLSLEQEKKEIIDKQVLSKKQLASQALTAGGIGLNMAGMLIGQKDNNLGGAVSTAGSVMTAAGQFMGRQWVSGIISLLSAGYQFYETWDNWQSNIEAKITDSVDKINDKLEKVNNYETGLRSSERLLEDYDNLIKKIYRTEAEQEKLNSIIQELADTYEIDVMTDKYGNLSIRIQDVHEAIKSLREEDEKAWEELTKQETESFRDSVSVGLFSFFSDLLNDTTISDFYEEFFSKNKALLKSYLSGLKDNLTPDTREISDTLANEINDSFKSAIVNYVEENVLLYSGEGTSTAIRRIQDEINDNLTDNNGYNELYSEIEYLQDNINNFSFEEITSNLNSFYEDWGERNNLTTEQLEIIKELMNDILFGNNQLAKLNDEVQLLKDLNSGSWVNDTQTKLKNKYKDDLEKFDKLNAKYSSIGALTSITPDPVDNLIISGIALFDKEYKEVMNKKQEYDKAVIEANEEQEKKIQEMADKYGTTKEGLVLIQEELEKTQKVMNDSSASTIKYVDNITELFNYSGLSEEEIKTWGDVSRDVLKAVEGVTDPAEQAEIVAGILLGSDNLPENLKKKMEKALKQALSVLRQPTGFTFSQLADELDGISEDLRSINDIMSDFNENGSIGIDTFKTLGEIIESIDFQSLYSMSDLENGIDYIDQYIGALENLNLAYDASTGQITMNGNALASLQKLQEIVTKGKILSAKNELQAAKAKTLTELAYVDSQIFATEEMIKSLKASGDATLTAKGLQEQATADVTATFISSTEDIQKGYETDTQNFKVWETAILNGLSTLSAAWGNYYAARSGKNVGDNFKNLKTIAENESKNIKWEGTKYSGINWDEYQVLDTDDKKKGLETELNDYLEKLKNSRTQYVKTLQLYDNEIVLLDDMYNKDLSKLGLKDEDKKKVEQYIGKLKEIYNILNRIQLLEHRLSTLDSYSDVAQGKQYGNLLKERLSYNKELMNQHEFLVTEQKKFTNGYKDFIQSIDGLEGVFDFDKFGQIVINWDKYNALQDTAIDGEVTMKEKADDVYETYTEMFTDLHGYFDSLIEYYKTVIDLQQEMVDSYISLQNDAADAVKEIYQKILDTKLDAIDQEKEAIEDLREARERANKDQENAKSVSGLQTNLQRAMMDTSGASDVEFLKAQQDIDEKLNDIAEDKYSQMLDDIIDKLEEEKESLQDEFDEMFDQLDWLFTWLDSDIMGNESELYNILKQTDDWNQSSFLERQQKLDEWSTKFYSYYDGILENEKGIYGIYENITNTRLKIDELDRNLKTYIGQGSYAITQTLAEWAKGNSNNGSGGGNGTTYNPIPYSGNEYNYDPNNGVKGHYDVITQYYKGDYNPDVEHGTFATTDTQGHRYQPNNVKKSKLTSTGATGADIGAYQNSSGVNIKGQTVWKSEDGKYYMWNGSKNEYELAHTLVRLCDRDGCDGATPKGLKALLKKHGFKYATGGFANFTGPAWLDGTPQKPEAVLNALQTEHFIRFTDALDKLTSGTYNTNSNSSVNIDSIQFNVESMSSVEDGEKAFDAFVNKFKEIGNQKGISISSFKNTL